MSGFYMTLPSWASEKEFSNNTANKFTVRLPQMLRFPEPGWKVGLSSITLPDALVDINTLVDANQYLFYMRWGVRVTENKKKTIANMDVRVNLTDVGPVTDGESLLRLCINYIEAARIRMTEQGNDFRDGKGKHLNIEYKWSSNGGERELLLQNKKISLTGVASAPKFSISTKFALKMGWLTVSDEDSKPYALGPNLRQEFISGTPPDMKANPHLQDLVSDIDPNLFVFWTASGNIMQLSLSCNWRFINLNNAFSAIVGSPNRTLHVYSNVGGSGILGDQVTDLLREIQYVRRGQGTSYFEPLHVQYLPLRIEVIETVETQIAEIDGTLVSFGNGQTTLVTLHFKREV